MKVLIDDIEVPCHNGVKIIYDNLEGGELHIAHTHEGMITDAIEGDEIMATESLFAQDKLLDMMEGDE